MARVKQSYHVASSHLQTKDDVILAMEDLLNFGIPCVTDDKTEMRLAKHNEPAGHIIKGLDLVEFIEDKGVMYNCIEE